MGFTLTRNCNFTSTSKLRTPEEELAAKAKHDRFKAMQRPKFSGTDKQIFVANKSLESFLFYAFHWSFDPDEVETFLQTYQGSSKQFWIANKPKAAGSGETRIAVENAIAEMKRRQQAEAKANQAIAEMSPEQLAAKVRRF
jgi:hypothetical protein